MIVNWKVLIGISILGLFTVVCGYIAGHAVAIHQHASRDEVRKLIRNADGKIDWKTYIIKALKDCKRMLDDPSGSNRGF